MSRSYMGSIGLTPAGPRRALPAHGPPVPGAPSPERREPSRISLAALLARNHGVRRQCGRFGRNHRARVLEPVFTQHAESPPAETLLLIAVVSVREFLGGRRLLAPGQPDRNAGRKRVVAGRRLGFKQRRGS